MYLLDEDQDEQNEPIETLHIYIYQDEPDQSQHSFSPQIRQRIQGGFIILILLCGIIALCLIPNTPAYTIQTVSVPAQFLPLQHFEIKTPITPTGTRSYPATIAHGTLTIFNGSVLTETLPAGFIVTSQNDVEIVTDQAATIPPGNPPAYGIAKVAAHSLTSGTQADIPAYAVNSAYGASLFLKNLTPFTGGADARTITYATSKDTYTALTNARYTLSAHIKNHPGDELLVRPCKEKTEQKELVVTVLWACQFVSYTYSPPPGAKVLSAQVREGSVLLQIRFVVRPRIIAVK